MLEEWLLRGQAPNMQLAARLSCSFSLSLFERNLDILDCQEMGGYQRRSGMNQFINLTDYSNRSGTSCVCVLMTSCRAVLRGHVTCFLRWIVWCCWHREMVKCRTIRPVVLFKDNLPIEHTISLSVVCHSRCLSRSRLQCLCLCHPDDTTCALLQMPVNYHLSFCVEGILIVQIATSINIYWQSYWCTEENNRSTCLVEVILGLSLRLLVCQWGLMLDF